MTQAIQDVKTLTALEFDKVKSKAKDVIANNAGDKPTREQFKREYESVFELLDVARIIVVVVLLAVSASHMFRFAHADMMTIANHALAKQSLEIQQTISFVDNEQMNVGISIDLGIETVIHQIGYFLLAELVMTLALLSWRLSKFKEQENERLGSNRITRFTGTTFESIAYLCIGLIALLVVFLVNLTSGMNPLLAILLTGTVFVITLRIENIYFEIATRKREIEKKYTQAMNRYELAVNEPTKHPDYQKTLSVLVFDKLKSKNKSLGDASTALQRFAVYKVLERDRVFDSGFSKSEFEGLQVNFK